MLLLVMLLLLMMLLLMMLLLMMLLLLMVLLLMVLLLRVLLLMRLLRLMLRVRVLRRLSASRPAAGVALAVPRVGAVARLTTRARRAYARAASSAVTLLPRAARDRTHLLDSRMM